MRDPLAPIPIKYKLTAAFAGICLLAFGVGGYLISDAAQHELEKEILLRMESQAENISSRLGGYLQLLARRSEDFASDGFIRTSCTDLITRGSERNPGSRAVYVELKRHLRINKFPLIDALAGLSLHDGEGRNIVGVGTAEERLIASIAIPSEARDSLWCSDVFDPSGGSDSCIIALATPLWDIRRERIRGSLVLWIDVAGWIASSGAIGDHIRGFDSTSTYSLIDPSGQQYLIRRRDNTEPTGGAAASTSAAYTVVVRKDRSALAREKRDTGDRHSIRFRRAIAATGWQVLISTSTEEALKSVSGLQSRFLGAGILFAAVALVLLFFPVRFLIQPLSHMRDAARRMANGDYSVRVQSISKDEIGDLAHAFNSMAEATQERTATLQHTANLLERKSTELRLERDLLTSVVRSMKDGLLYIGARGEILLSNESAVPLAGALTEKPGALQARRCDSASGPSESCAHCLLHSQEETAACSIDLRDRVYEILSTRLGARDRPRGRILVARDITDRVRIGAEETHHERLAMLGEIAAVMAHELNNPLAAISMYTQMMDRDTPHDGPHREHIDVIKRNTELCTRTIRDLLDYSRQASPEVSDFDLFEILEDVVRFLRPMYEKARIAFDLRFAEGGGIMRSDEMYVRQIFINLLLNAIHALEAEGGTIVVDARPAGSPHDRLLVRVIDSGPGIPSEWHERIFEPFFTSKPSGKGTGLGLPTARRITEALHGRLGLASSEPGCTEFVVELPRQMQESVWTRAEELESLKSEA